MTAPLPPSLQLPIVMTMRIYLSLSLSLSLTSPFLFPSLPYIIPCHVSQDKKKKKE